MTPRPFHEPLEQEPLPQLRDAGEPLVEVPLAAQKLGQGEDFVRGLCESGQLLAYGRNGSASPGKQKRTRWFTTARALKLYEARTANFTGYGTAKLLAEIAVRLSPKLRLWLRNEITRSLEQGD